MECRDCGNPILDSEKLSANSLSARTKLYANAPSAATNTMEGRTYTEMHGSDATAAGRTWAPPAMVTEFDVNARLTFTSIKAHEYVHWKRECVWWTHPGVSRSALCTLHSALCTSSKREYTSPCSHVHTPTHTPPPPISSYQVHGRA